MHVIAAPSPIIECSVEIVRVISYDPIEHFFYQFSASAHLTINVSYEYSMCGDDTYYYIDTVY